MAPTITLEAGTFETALVMSDTLRDLESWLGRMGKEIHTGQEIGNVAGMLLQPGKEIKVIGIDVMTCVVPLRIGTESVSPPPNFDVGLKPSRFHERGGGSVTSGKSRP